ncbi:MAG: PaaX domain-containing protein [Halanaeroarchaeum sp.]
MPIDLRNHDPTDAITIRPDSNKAKIIKLLYQDTNLGYKPAEIRQTLDIARGSTSTTLSRLHDDGLIGKTSDGLYHGFDHRDDLRRFARSLVQLDAMFDRYPDPGYDPENVEQTGETAKEPIPDERRQDTDVPGDEPVPDEWVDGSAKKE